MDDFVLSNLQESRNEWCSRLVSIFCPLVIEGMKSIFNEAWKICHDTNEPAKYLMTFQNFLSHSNIELESSKNQPEITIDSQFNSKPTFDAAVAPPLNDKDSS